MKAYCYAFSLFIQPRHLESSRWLTGWRFRVWFQAYARFFISWQRPEAHPASYLPGTQIGSVKLNTHMHLYCGYRKKSPRSIPTPPRLPPLQLPYSSRQSPSHSVRMCADSDDLGNFSVTMPHSFLCGKWWRAGHCGPSGVIDSDILDSGHLPIVSHILDRVKT
jgi:hypothetical protein